MTSALINLQENSSKTEEKIIILLNGSHSDIENQITIKDIIQIKSEQSNSILYIEKEGGFSVNNVLKLNNLKIMFTSSINIENFFILKENCSLFLEVLTKIIKSLVFI